MKTSQRGYDLIKKFEGLSLKAYPDPATGGAPWTIGFGHTSGVHNVDTCTGEEAFEWLQEDCKEAEDAINELVDVELNQNQFDALVSFVFNLGRGTLASSTLLKLLNEEKFEAANKQFMRFDKAGGKVMAGLTHRRAAEAQLFGESV